ncbi:MAG: SixA phosphatase family protein [Polyangiales bacterium]
MIVRARATQLFLVRHAPALPRAAGGGDAARPLSPEGSASFGRSVRGLERLGLRFDRLYHSPWLRAVQTADALMPLVDGESVVCPDLARAPSAELLSCLRGERVALVGHEPWLSALCAWLMLGSPASGNRLVIKKGGVVRLQGKLAPSGMELLALLPPKALRALG